MKKAFYSLVILFVVAQVKYIQGMIQKSPVVNWKNITFQALADQAATTNNIPLALAKGFYITTAGKFYYQHHQAINDFIKVNPERAPKSAKKFAECTAMDIAQLSTLIQQAYDDDEMEDNSNL